MIEILAREEIENKYKWRLDKIYADEQAWENDLACLRELLPQGAAFAGRLGESAERLLQAVQWQERAGQLLEKLDLYAYLHHDENTGDQHYQALAERVQSLAVQFSQTMAYFTPEVLAIDPATLEQWLCSEQLRPYRRLFDDITRFRPHTLSAAEEQLLAGTAEMASGFSASYSLLSNSDLPRPVLANENGEEERLSEANYVRLLRCSNREVRKNAFTAMYNSYSAFGSTIASLLGGSIRKDNFYAAAGHYNSALHSSLFSDNVEESVYRNLIRVVRSHRGDMARYLRRRRELLGVDKLHMYDLYVPLFPEYKQEFSWDEAKETALAALYPLGDDYRRTLRTGLDNGWVDVYPNKGKRSGAYSSGCFGTDPYILLNFMGELDSVFTLIHESGHSMHSYYSRHTQPYVYADYRIFVAEVASTVNENLLIRHLLRQSSDPQQRRYLVNHYLEEFRATVIRQTMFAEFELKTHEMAARGEALTAQSLCELYYQLNLDYFGDDVEVDDAIRWEWARIPHFYSAFYVYKYATGFCAASALAQGLLDEDPQRAAAARERYLRFLSAGCSKDPLDLLADAGVDMRGTEAVEQAFRLFSEMIDAL